MEILVKFFAFAFGFAAATWALALWRARRAETDFPPTGRFLDLPAGRLHYRQAGTGPDVVLLHGASGSIREFDFGLFDALAQRYRVTAFDRPGLGYSNGLAEDSLSSQAAHLAQACEALGIGDPLLVGQSFGGSVALAWALQGGQKTSPRALVLIGAPVLPWPGELDLWYRLNRGILGRSIMPWLAAAWVWPGYVSASLASIFAPDTVPDGYAAHIGTELTIRQQTLRANVAQVNALRRSLVTMEPLYPRLTLPIELLHGEADTVVQIDIHARPFAQRLANVTLTILPQTGHMPHHSHLPEVLAAIDRAHSHAIVMEKGDSHGPAL